MIESKDFRGGTEVVKRINNEDFPVHVEIKLNGAQHLKIQNANSGYAIANVYVY